MNKNYFGILFALMLVLSVGSAYAALGVGSWIANDSNNLSIYVGDTAEFRYGITAVTIYGGQYSIMLYREGNANPLVTYVNNQATVGNGALGGFNVTSQNYGNTVGKYYVLINSVDKYSSHSYRLDLNVASRPLPQLTVTCNPNTLSGTAPLNVAFNAQANGGTGVGTYTYKWILGDNNIITNSQNQISHTYNDGTFTTSVIVTDSANHEATASCGTITVNKVIPQLTATCGADKTVGTAPFSVTFTGQANGGTGSYIYTYNYGDNTQSSSQQSHTYNNYGTYNPTLTVKDSANTVITINCPQITANKAITPIIASCNANPTSGNAPLSVAFNAQANGGVGAYSYKWNFGDNSYLTTNVPQITKYVYYNAGTYPTSVTVTDSANNYITVPCGTITVNPIPITPLSIKCDVDKTNGILPLTIIFTPTITTGTAPYTYTWNYGEGTPSNTQGQTIHTYNNQGTYNPTLTITDANGQTKTTNCGLNAITVNPKPLPTLTAKCYVDKTSGTTPLSVTFSSDVSGGTGIYSYKWTLGDGITASNQNSLTYSYSTAGTYNPILTITDSANNVVTANCPQIIANKPAVQIIASCNANPTSGNAPLSVAFNAQATGGIGAYSYKWDFGDNSQLTTNVPQITKYVYYNAGTYSTYVTVMDSQFNQVRVPCGTITVNPVVIPPLAIRCDVDKTSGILPLTIIFTPTITTGTAPYTYTWNYGEGTPSNTQGQTIHTYNNQGTYNPTLTITDANGQTKTTNCGLNAITVNPKPNPTLIVSCAASPTNGNVSLNVQFSSSVTGGSGIYTYSWTFGDGTTASNQNSVTHTYNNQGTYNPTLKITDSNNVVVTASCTTNGITVNPKPLPTLTATCNPNTLSGTIPLNVIFDSKANGGTGIYTYIWKFGDGQSATTPTTSSTQISQTHNYNTAGTYHTTLEIIDSANNYAIANCADITANKPIPTLTASCAASPTSGDVPLNVQFSSSVTGGSGTYSYSWTFGDGASASGQNSLTHIYATAGTYNPTLKVTDSNNVVVTTSCTTNGIHAATPILNIDNINCFPRVTDGANQSCSVFVKSSNGKIAGNVDVSIYYIDGTLFGTCKTNALSGACEVEKIVHGVGTKTVYATASASGFISDTDTQPRFTFEVFTQRYNIINLDTYKDSNFYYVEHTFYRGQPIYAKFQVYDPETNSFVAKDIVTAASLVSLPGGRADLSRITYSNNWYYYKLDAIPLNHYFLGDSNVFAFAFNFTGMTSGQAQVNLTILNNKPTISNIAEVDVKVDNNYSIFLNNYGSDLEDQTLRWNILNNPTLFSAKIDVNAGNVLTIKGLVVGTESLTLRGYDLDNDYAEKSIVVHVIPGIIIVPNLTATCTPNMTSGITPISVTFNTQVSGGTGPYTYSWTLGDGYISSMPNTLTHVYTTGTYNPNVVIKDSSNRTITTNCGQIIVSPKPTPTLTASCNPNTLNGTIPLNVIFDSKANGGTGIYTYIWKFGDGQSATTPTTSSTQISQTHNYNTAGTYHTTLEIIDSENNYAIANCADIAVSPKPTPTLTASCNPNTLNGTIPLNVIFDSKANGGTGIYTYIWKFGDGQSATTPTSNSTQISLTHKYEIAGNYHSTLEIIDSENNYAIANCADITANPIIIPNITLDVSCVAMPSSGVAPLIATLTASVSNGNAPYIYIYDYEMGYTTTSQDNIAYQNYNAPGVYNPRVSVTDTDGHSGSASCGLIVVSTNNNTNLIANAGGPYTGYINEAVNFDGSLSSGNIVRYRWDFGDGTVVDTVTPLVQHEYRKINRYTVTLTVFDTFGNFNYATTTALIIERTSSQVETERDVPDKGIVIKSLLLYGQYGEILKSDDELTTQITLKNEWDKKLENVRIIVSIPELGIETRSSLFDFTRGAEHSETLILPLYDISPGTYYVRISVDNDQGNDQVRRVKYREIVVKK